MIPAFLHSGLGEAKTLPHFRSRYWRNYINIWCKNRTWHS